MEGFTKIKDFFDRDTGTFVPIDEDKKFLHWEHSIEAGEAYSTFFVDSEMVDSEEDACRYGFSLSRSFIASVAHPTKIYVNFGEDDSSYTDGKTVTLGTGVFKDPDLPYMEMIDVLLGECVHEVAHILYTDFKVWNSEIKKHPNPPIMRNVMNILEDERIEIEVGKHHPGHARFLEKVKYYFFDRKFMEEFMRGKEEGYVMNDAEEIFMLFMRMIRYPIYVDEVMYDKHKELIDEIREVVVPYALTTMDVADHSREILDILKDHWEEMPERDEEEETTFEESLEGMMEEMSKTFDSKEDKGGSKREEKSDEGKRGDKIPSDVRKIIISEKGKFEMGHGDEVFFIKAKPYESKYEESRKHVHQYASTLSRVMALMQNDYEFSLKSMRSGRLDTGKLAEAVQGIQTIYERKGVVETEKVSVVLLVDMSGSMSGEKIAAARDCAILFQLALAKVKNVELFVYGHTGDHETGQSTEIYVFKEPGHENVKTMGAICAMGQNRDGVAIRETALRVRKFTKAPCLFLVLADGAPCASGYGGSMGVADTRKAVHEISQKGFIPIGVSIESHLDPSSMFKNYVTLTDWDKLPKDIGRLMRKSVSGQLKRTVTVF